MKICVFGVRYCDIVMYLARLLHTMGEQVLICDRTPEKAMRLYFPDIRGLDMSDNLNSYRGVDYAMRGMLADGVSEENYSYVFELEEITDIPRICSDQDEQRVCLIVGDEDPANAARLEEMAICLKECQRDRNLLVIRDYTGTIREQYAAMRSAVCTTSQFMLPYHRGDVRAALGMAYKGSSRFTSVSEDMYELLSGIMVVLKPEVRGRSFRKYYRMAEKGGNR